MTAVTYPDEAKSGAEGMLNDYKDIVGNVIERLAVLSNLFEFYQYTHEMTNFSHDAVPGLCVVIDDCINALKTIV